MKSPKCSSCGQDYEGWVEFCPHCGEAIENYSQPAGFWIRFGAQIIDGLIFLPIGLVGYWNSSSLKNMILLVLISWIRVWNILVADTQNINFIRQM